MADLSNGTPVQIINGLRTGCRGVVVARLPQHDSSRMGACYLVERRYDSGVCRHRYWRRELAVIGTPRGYDPTPAEIAAACERIREGWPEATERARTVQKPAGGVEAMVVCTRPARRQKGGEES